MRIVRLTLVGSLALTLVLLAGCQSNNNNGSIIGKWETTSPLPGAETMPEVKAGMEFTADGKFSFYAVISGEVVKTVASGTYRLGMGDKVSLDNLNPPIDGKTSSVEQITINGNELKMKDSKKGTLLIFAKVADPVNVPIKTP